MLNKELTDNGSDFYYQNLAFNIDRVDKVEGEGVDKLSNREV